MKNYDESVEIYHNPNWPYMLNHPYRVLINGGSESGKTSVTEFNKNIKDHILTKFI